MAKWALYYLYNNIDREIYLKDVEGKPREIKSNYGKSHHIPSL